MRFYHAASLPKDNSRIVIINGKTEIDKLGESRHSNMFIGLKAPEGLILVYAKRQKKNLMQGVEKPKI